MKAKKLLSVVLAVCIMAIYAVPAWAAETPEGTEQPFAGTRTIELKIDSSDLENFVNGGRFAFETELRKNAPEWLTFTTVTKGRDYYLTLSFDFKTFEDYKAYLAFVVSYEPPVLLDNADTLVLVEGFSSIELINFLQLSLDGSSSTAIEFPLKDLFTVTANKILLNGKTYEQGERITIVPDDMKPVKLDGLSVMTTGNADGSFTRRLTASLNDGDSDDIADLKKKFEAIGETSTESYGNLTEIIVDFEASTQSELITKTISALSVTNSISEQKQIWEKKNIKVFRTEFLDIEALKRSDNFIFSYEYKIPDYYEKAEPGDTAIMDGKIVSNDRDTTSIAYEIPFAFTGVSVETDFSKIYSKTKRTIDFTAPTYLAETFHEKTKKALEDKLTRGVTLDIFDDKGVRHYSLSYSSWFMKDIEKFTTDVAGFTCEIEASPALLPVQKGALSETLSVENPLNSKIPFSEVSCSYIFSNLAKLYCGSENLLQRSSTSLSFNRSNGIFTADFEYLKFDVVKTVIIAIILILLIVMIVKASKAVKKLKSKIKEKPKKEPKPKTDIKETMPTPPVVNTPVKAVEPTTTQVAEPPVKKDIPAMVAKQSFCPTCGTENELNSKFCKKCGHSL